MKMSEHRIFYNFMRWRARRENEKLFLYLLSIATGLLAGLMAVIIKNLVYFIQMLISYGLIRQYENYLFFIYPLTGIIITVLFVKYLVRHSLGHGIPGVLHSISKKQGRMPVANIYGPAVASALTIGFGGSAGMEGPSVSSGAAIGSNLAHWLRIPYKNAILLIGCASAGAIAALFKAPIAGVLFSLEVLMLDLTMTSLIPLLLAAVTGTLTSYFFLGQNVIYHFRTTEGFAFADIPFYALLGVFCGVISVIFSKTFTATDKLMHKIGSAWTRLFAGGLILGILIFFLPPLFGEGYNEINECLSGNYQYIFNFSLFYEYKENIAVGVIILLLIFFVKGLATAVTLSAGGVGGTFAPSLFIGSHAGLWFALVVGNLEIRSVGLSNFALAGMAGVMAGIMHAPLTSIFLIADITGGYGMLVPLIIVSALAFMTSRFFIPFSINAKQLAESGDLITHDKDKAVLSRMTIEKLIEKDFLTIGPDETLGSLVKVISRSSRNIFPVTDQEGYMLGVVFVNDIRHIVFQTELYDKIFVRELMYMPTVVVEPEESMEDIAMKFEQSQHYNLPVLNDGKYLGFISRANVFSEYRQMVKSFSEQ